MKAVPMAVALTAVATVAGMGGGLVACGGSSSSTSSAASSSSGSRSSSTSTSSSSGSVGSSSGSGSSSSGVSAQAACAAEAQAVCKLRDTCSMNSFLNDKAYGSDSVCQNRIELGCPSSLAAMGTGQSPARVEGCAAQYASETCTEYLDDDPQGDCVPPAGSLPLMSPCGASGQCDSTFCAVSQHQICGTCQNLPAVGSTCQVDADCGRDLACAVAAGATSGVCAAWVGPNGACLTDVNPCQAGYGCVGDAAPSTMGTCQPLGSTLNADCDSAHVAVAQCNGNLGLTCIPSAKGMTTGTCQAITLVAAGADCGPIGSAPITGYADCEAGGLCVGGKCVAPANDGDPCNTDPKVGPPCLAPSKCVVNAADGGTAGTCTLPNASSCQ